MPTDTEKLLGIIEQKLDWGQSAGWQSRDFENLNQRILTETGVSLSASTLRRIWGRVEYKHIPSGTTLDTLAKFAGYQNWREFIRTQPDISTATVQDESFVTRKKTAYNIPWFKIASVSSIIIAAILVCIVAFKKAPAKADARNYSFSSKPVSREIPNSVIFTYDATAAQNDSVFIQQSWDPHTRTPVDKGLHKHTSIYYEPGFYHAKLVVGNRVVMEHPLLIPTSGWLGIIENKPVPIYLEPSEFIHGDGLKLPVSAIGKKNIAMQPSPRAVKFFNVGNFEPVPVTDFSFSAEVKNEYWQGAAACQFTEVALITDDGPFFIPLSATGCVSELNLMNEGQFVSGKKTDLSGFGVDFSHWAQVSCNGSAGKVQFFVNGKLAYGAALPAINLKIVGIGFLFQGSGAVKNIKLTTNGKTVFQAFLKRDHQ